MDLVVLLATGLALIAAVEAVAWRISLRLENAAVADVVWPIAIAATAWWGALVADGVAARRLVLLVLVTAWAVRLALHLAIRIARHGEDRRYAAMRERHGEAFRRVSLWTVFGFQGLLAWMVSLPLMFGMAADRPRALTAAAVLGIVVWAVGFAFETVADWQLARFRRRRDRGGDVLQTGVWRYSRHPNYFGEVCVWWGIFLVVAPTPLGFAAVVGPLLVTVLVTRVSGVPLTEKGIGTRRPAYREYAFRTNAFFPGPPRDTPTARTVMPSLDALARQRERRFGGRSGPPPIHP